jgi:hypothetical protein
MAQDVLAKWQPQPTTRYAAQESLMEQVLAVNWRSHDCSYEIKFTFLSKDCSYGQFHFNPRKQNSIEACQI